MGKLGAFKEIPREVPEERPVEERVQDYRETYVEFPPVRLQAQASRCMSCGIPFCNSGCPLGNLIPDWNDQMYRGRLKDALDLLLSTNNFPEFTGRVCPAPCEEACVLNIHKAPVSIKLIEESIIEQAFKAGLITPQIPQRRTGRKVAVVGSGPAGLACAAQLNRVGHAVTVFERASRVGGLLTYGIPGFKLEKRIVERRIDLMRQEGVVFVTGAAVGQNPPIEELRQQFNAIVLCCGSTVARNLDVPGRDLKGIHFAMEFLPQQNHRNLGDAIPVDTEISAKGKSVVILGGGDTGADCLGTAIRQGCKSVYQFELLPEPPVERTADMPWPRWPMILRTSSAHKESAALQASSEALARHRDFSIATKAFTGEGGLVKKLRAVRVAWNKDSQGRMGMQEIPGSEFELDCDLCLLALGFLHPEHQGPVEQLGLVTDSRGNVKTDQHYMTNVPRVFSAGDMRRGQSLVVWAISEGRQAARAVDSFLMGRSDLPEIKLW